jgi:DNA-binding MarR family transcriptional regulator
MVDSTCVSRSRIEEHQYRLLLEIFFLLDDGDRRLLRRFHLNPSSYAVLLRLGASEGLRLKDLSDLFLLNKSTITRIVDRLEQDGLVKRIADPDDRRAQRVVLTSEGASLRAQAQAAHKESLQRRFSVLSPVEREQLDELLQKLHTGLRTDLDAPGGQE